MATEEPTTDFGQFIADAMLAHVPPLERGDLAKMVGVSPSTLSRWLLTEISPMPAKLRALADALGVPEDEVFVAAGHRRRTSTPIQVVKTASAKDAIADMDELATELGRMLAPASPLTGEERNRLRLVTDAQMAPYRSKMRTKKRVS